MSAACIRTCLLRLPYATILSTLVSTCGLFIGLTALFDATSIIERFSIDLLQRNYILLNDLKLGYVFAALFIIIVILFNLGIGFIATDQSLYHAVESPHNARNNQRGCCRVSCLKSSTAICLLQTFLVFNYVIYYVLFLVTILSFIGFYTAYISTILCNQAPYINLNTEVHGKIPMDDEKVVDLRQFAPVIGLRSNETELLYFRGQRYQRLCHDYVTKFNFHIILCTIGLLLACAGFVNFLINFSVNSAKLSTKQKFSELVYLKSEILPLDDEAKY